MIDTKLAEVWRRIRTLERDVEIVKAMVDGLNMRLTELEELQESEYGPSHR